MLLESMKGKLHLERDELWRTVAVVPVVSPTGNPRIFARPALFDL